MQPSLSCIVLGAVVALYSPPVRAESNHGLIVAGGLGYAFPTRQDGRDVAGKGAGGYGEVEYVYKPDEWVTPRLYTGVLLTAADSSCGSAVSPCDVSAKLFFLGAKVRLMIPIPYVGPFVEAGLGASAGTISTRSGRVVDVTGRGVMYHVPFALGLAVGARHQYAIAFQYLFHPEQQQVCGAFALGFGFPLD
ncbi:MAG: hypothetical protein ACJ79R_17425 [Anaeromyxobacteraceae bacterium]